MEKPIVRVVNDEAGEWMTLSINGIHQMGRHRLDGRAVLDLLDKEGIIKYEYETVEEYEEYES